MGIPRGIYAASLTPVTDELEIDYERLNEHCRRLMNNGCDGVCLLGTTGEANSFSVKQRRTALATVLEGGVPPEKLLVGTGCSALDDTIELTRQAVDYKVGGILLLPPFYYKSVSDAGIYAGIARLIDAAGTPDLNIYLYHFPQMSAVSFSHNLIEKLLRDFPGIVLGMKDSSGDYNHMRTVIDEFPGFEVYAGSERFLSDILEVNGAGCISATANLTSQLMRQVFDRPATERPALQKKLDEIRDQFEQYAMIPALKLAIAEQTGDRTWLNLVPPQAPLDVSEKGLLLDQLAAVIQTA